ncbi:heparan-alpha-glucosaminide N-acetyltransferase domain-containing protein [uncultured Psychroserpens sp.]|uniref:DUF1624 domain-containing protein n=1 Tax=uncultured Psychroserpens sp. TaxID=255436 RepID=UPI0026209C06|nr:heparan-alpha-glucosaminide N-acetyltransferase domain-containing protein [uncultured Psychroserpens sp.]
MNIETKNRISYIDNVRGLIMAIMAIDHVSFFIRKVHYSEYWGTNIRYASTTDFISRAITHICAPGFFLLMGMGLYLFAENRLSKGWSKHQIFKWFLKRGIVLILIQQFIENPAWILSVITSGLQNEALLPTVPGDDGSSLILVLSVLFSLGCSLILGSLCIYLKRFYWLVVALIIFIGSEFIILNSNPEIGYNGLLRVFVIAGKTGFFSVLYPIFPWFGITLIGMYIAKFARYKNNAFFVAGCICALVFIAIKLPSLGNENWLVSLSLVKYPPSVDFISLYLSIIFFILYFFKRFKVNISMLSVFGKVPLFFYILHIWIYSLIGLDFKFGTTVIPMYSIWLVSLIPLYWLSIWYLEFSKKKKETSFWRLL